jgi:glutamate-1-semialdehyde 2,1-aminomutase
MSIEQEYADFHPGSEKLYRRAGAVFPSGVTHDSRYLRPFPVYVTHAAGSRKWDVDGHEYVDYVVGHGALLLGHNHPAVASAARAQLERGTHYGASHEAEIEWAEEVVRLVPSAEAVRFTSSGTEATLMALRIARAATGKPGVLKFEHHFHGWHDYVTGSSKYGGAAPAGVPQPALDTVVVVAPEMSVVRETLAGAPEIGAVIVEPAGAGSGTLPLPRGFLGELEECCRRAGVLLVMDEVVTGFRWRPGGVQEEEGLRPDLTTLAKVLAGGFPGGAVAGRRDLLERLAFREDGSRGDKIGHPGTFNANPLSAAAGVACLREVGDGRHQAKARELASRLRAGMNGELRRLGIPGLVYGQASEFRIVLGGESEAPAGDCDPRDLPLDAFAAGTRHEVERLLNLAMLTRGVHLFGNGGMTSSVHTDDDLARTIEAWSGTLTALRSEGAIAR